MVNLRELQNSTEPSYEKQLFRLKNKGLSTSNIEEAVTKVSDHVINGKQSLVIYGEPQSGKTEMMICLTSKLLDNGFKCIVILITDSLDLLTQNQTRFRMAGITPPPRSLEEVIQNSDQISKNKSPVVVFCKKNSKDLEKLISSIRKIRPRIIIDDEGDYATPNSRINSKDKEASKINGLVTKLVDFDSGGVWIGVTATPARLNLNSTLNNDKEAWVRFKPHDQYVGVETFFPLNPVQKPKFKLNLLNGQFDQSRELKNALKSFVCSVAVRNIGLNSKEENYSMVIHTSGKKDDHRADHVATQAFFHDLESGNQKLYDELENHLRVRTQEYSLTAMRYIYANRQRYVIRTVNSETDRKTENIKLVTEPQTPFTVAIGGNIISRGVTFDNLLSLFFTRNTEGRMQQDTYIQRARMFGNRKPYLHDMEITVPTTLFEDWHRLFVLHHLALISVEQNDPIWLEEGRIRAAAPGSIDRSRLSMSSGEIKSEIFKVDEKILHLTESKLSGHPAFESLLRSLPSEKLVPKYLIDFVKSINPSDVNSLVIHPNRLISESSYTDVENLERPRGFLGGNERETNPRAVHHFLLIYNKKGSARLLYKYQSGSSTLRFLKLN